MSAYGALGASRAGRQGGSSAPSARTRAWGRPCALAGALGLALGLLAGPAAGQAVDPWAGWADADLQRLAEELRAGRDARALAEGQAALIHELLGQVEALEAAVAELRRAEEGRGAAVAIAEDRDKRRAENEAALLAIIERYRVLLDEQAKMTRQAVDRAETLERRQWWTTILSVLGVLAAVAIGAL